MIQQDYLKQLCQVASEDLLSITLLRKAILYDLILIALYSHKAKKCHVAKAGVMSHKRVSKQLEVCCLLLSHLTLKEDDNIEEDGIFVTDVPASDSEEADSESSGSYDQESSGSSSEDDAPSKPIVAAQSDGVVKHSPSEDTIKVFRATLFQFGY